MSIASAACPAIAVADSTVSALIGLPGRNEKMPSDAITSAGVATGTIAPVQPFSRNGSRRSFAIRRRRRIGAASRKSRCTDVAPNGCGRHSTMRTASASPGP